MEAQTAIPGWSSSHTGAQGLTSTYLIANPKGNSPNDLRTSHMDPPPYALVCGSIYGPWGEGAEHSQTLTVSLLLPFFKLFFSDGGLSV